MIHPDTKLRSAGSIGLGVFATRDIPKGTIVWVLDSLDQQLDASRVASIGEPIAPMIQRYAYQNSTGNWILCWDHARFINHSCRANAISTGWDFDLAVEDIAAGTQITNDYGCLNINDPFECLCGAPGCRGVIRGSDFDTMAAYWDARVSETLEKTLSVSQPLWSLLPNPLEVQHTAATGGPPPSIRFHQVNNDHPTETAQRL